MVKTETKTHTELVPSNPMHQPSPSASSINDKKKKYKGVRMRSWGSWVSEIRAPNQKTRIWLGSYSTAEAAARAYDAALLCLKGSSANLNFPSNSSSQYIPQDTTVMSPKSIQRVAAAAANNFNSHSPSPASESSSSPSDQVDDYVPLLSPPFGAYTSIDQGNESIMSMIEPLYDFDYCLQYSPKYVDQMLTGVLFDIDSTQLLDDDLYEESDIRLWNFC